MKKIVLLVLISVLIIKVNAQEFKPSFKENAPTLSLSVSPFSFFMNKAEIGLDFRLKERQWLSVTPILQFRNTYGDINTVYDTWDAVKEGFGIKLNYRYFPLTRTSKSINDGLGPFVSAGIRGMSTTYDYIGNSYVEFTDVYGTLGYVMNGNTHFNENVTQLGLEVNIGYSLRLFDILFAETYIGMGAKYSDYEHDPVRGLDLGGDNYDTGYSGYAVTGGFRIGIFLNKYSK